MCSIVGGIDFKEVSSTTSYNRDRGTKQWSMSIIDIDLYDIAFKHNSANSFSEEEAIRIMEAYMKGVTIKNPYYIIHVQSPTGKAFNWHPAEKNDGHFLWHNGMIDRVYADKESVVNQWDTQHLLNLLVPEDQPVFSNLEKFKGSFACYYLQKGKGLYCFRNSIAPQFHINNTLFGSKLRIDKGVKTLPNQVYDMMMGTPISTFHNTYNPYGVE